MNIIILQQSNLSEIAESVSKVIDSGGLAIVPFDTVYGFVCDPRNDSAIERIFKLKERPETKTIGIALDHIFTAKKLGEAVHWDFTEGKVPGPYTFIIKAKERILSKYCYKDNTLAFRIPNSELVYDIILEAGGIIAQTSANKSGQPNCLSLEDLKSQFSNEELNLIDLIVDGGKLADGTPSEIWNLTVSTPQPIPR